MFKGPTTQREFARILRAQADKLEPSFQGKGVDPTEDVSLFSYDKIRLNNNKI